MLETFFGAVFVGLVLFGLLVLCYGIMLKLMLPKRKYTYYVVIPARRCDSDVTAAAYAARMKMHLIGDELYGNVVVLDGKGDVVKVYNYNNPQGTEVEE